MDNNIIDTQSIRKNLIVGDITASDIDSAIVNFNNGRLGIVDGALSQACSKALNELLPKNITTIPAAAMETATLSFGRYKPIHEYAKEQQSVADEVLGMLYVYPEDDKKAFNDTVKLTETARLMNQKQKDASVIYCPPTAGDNAKQDAAALAQDNDIVYTEDIQSAVEHWSGQRVLKKKVKK